jgi:menaquinone-dependent protoporphyrinogen oxidase
MKEPNMKKILVTYATSSGSTAEVAQAIGEELRQAGHQVDVLAIEKASKLDSYEALVVGAPMILGWHRRAISFLRKNRGMLRRIPLAVFLTCMSLTRTGESSFLDVPISVDEDLPKPPQDPARLTFRERYSLPSHYLRPIFKACPVKPVSAGIFAGQLNFSSMKWWAMIFVVLILQAKAGDKRNWEAIRNWAKSLPVLLNAGVAQMD